MKKNVLLLLVVVAIVGLIVFVALPLIGNNKSSTSIHGTQQELAATSANGSNVPTLVDTQPMVNGGSISTGYLISQIDGAITTTVHITLAANKLTISYQGHHCALTADSSYTLFWAGCYLDTPTSVDVLIYVLAQLKGGALVTIDIHDCYKIINGFGQKYDPNKNFCSYIISS